MSWRRTCIYLSNRRWYGSSLALIVIIVLILYISCYQVLLLLERKTMNHQQKLISFDAGENVGTINDKISDIKKNINDIVYQGVDDEDSSQESFLGLLGVQNQSLEVVDELIQEKRIDLSIFSQRGKHFFKNTFEYISKKQKRLDGTKFVSNYKFRNFRRSNKRFLYILGHYEQLGKTLINLMHAGLLAAVMGRKLVVPFVRNSRLCGLQIGWIGTPRKKSREFLAIDNYFDLSSLETLFHEQGFADLVQFQKFHSTCKNKQTDSMIVYFFYAQAKTEIQRYLHLTNTEYNNILKEFEKNKGWTDCSNIEKEVESGKRMKNIYFTRAVCVNAEAITRIEDFEWIVGNVTCLSIFLWRGIGPQRTHFNITLPLSYDNYLARLSFSDILLQEAQEFQRKFFSNRPFIGIQIRSERQLTWYGLDKFKHCLDLVVKVASIFVYKKRIGHIFVSSDLEKHGSDSLTLVMNKSSLNEAKQYFTRSFQSLPVTFYKADKSRGLIYNDAGFVALTQMEILSHASHLITLGAGTFQNWVTKRFKDTKGTLKDNPPWSLTRICSVEVKAGKKHKLQLMDSNQ